MIAWFVKLLFLVTAVGFAASLGWLHAVPTLQAFRNRMAREVKKFQRLSQSLLKRPTDREAQTVFLSSLGVVGLLWLIVFPGFWLKVVAGWPCFEIGWRFPLLLVQHQCRQRIRKFQDQLVDILTLVSNALKSGLSLMQAFGMVSTEMPDPAGAEFRHLLAQQQVGQTLEAGLAEMLERVPSDDLKLISQAILTLKETGGNLASTFDTMTEMMRERQRVLGKIRSLTAQGVVQSVVISAMPAGLLIMFSLTAPDFVKPLLHTSLGWVCLGFVFFLQAIGGLVMKKIITIKV